jgi:maleate isomerase
VIRVGVLTPHAAIGPEAEFPAMAPGQVVTCVSRVPVDPATGADSTTASGLRSLIAAPVFAEAAAMLAQGSLDVIAYASTTSAYAIGPDAESALVSKLSEESGAPAVGTCASAVLALRALGAERVALVHPPWTDPELNELGVAYFQRKGFEVVSSAAADLSRDPDRIDAAAVYDWTSRDVGGDTEAVFIGGNGFRAAGAVGALEASLDCPVLTSNQVLLWSGLGRTGATAEVSGYGRIFAHTARSLTR